MAEGLIDRADDPANRRQLTLTLTPDGERVVQDGHAPSAGGDQAHPGPAEQHMTKQRRAELVALLQEFAAAGGEPSDPDLWAMGWTT